MKKIILFLSCFFVFTFSAYAQWMDIGAPDFINTAKLHCDDSGNLYAAGRFFCESKDTVSYMVKWDGSSWNSLPAPNNNVSDWIGRVFSISTFNTNRLYMAGTFYNSSNLYYVAQWNGTNWIEAGGVNALALNLPANFLCHDTLGNLYAVFNSVTSPGYSVAKWDGTQWTKFGGSIVDVPSGNPTSYLWGLCFDKQQNMYAIGAFRNAFGSYYVAKWDGNNWSQLGGNGYFGYGELLSLISDGNGNIYTAGRLQTDDGKNYVAKWNGTSWIKLFGSYGFRIASFVQLCTDKFNNIYASGKDAANNLVVSKWNGSEWIDLEGMNYFEKDALINSLCTDTAGNLYVSANYYKDAICVGKIGKYSKAYLVGQEEGRLENAEIFLSPNPCRDKLSVVAGQTISGNTPLSVKIRDLFGNLLFEKDNLPQKSIIDIADYTPGVYFVSMGIKGRWQTSKLIKE